jgi:hypothetical protein
MPTVTVGRDQSCARPSLAELGAASGVVATACALDPWLSAVLAGVEFVPADKRPGAVFTAQAGGLRGIAVWLDRSPGTTEMRLYEVAPDGRTLGAAVATAQAVGLDEVGLAAFAFDPIVDSAGKRYAFSLSCDGCAPAEVPLMYSGVVTDGGGNFTVGNDQRVDRVAAFVPVHDEIPPATTPHTVIQAENPDPGSWRIAADGPNPVLLVVAETWFPGWSATVDGKSTPVLQADGAFLGVAVPAGAHTVTLDFRRPVSGVVGRVITAITLIVLVIGYWLRPGPRRERPARGPRRGRRSPSAARDSDADADAEPDERDRPDLDWEEAVAPSRPRPQSGSVSGSSSGSSPGGASASG